MRRFVPVLTLLVGGCALALGTTGAPSDSPGPSPGASATSASPDAGPSPVPSGDPSTEPSPTPTAATLHGYVTTVAGGGFDKALPPGATDSVKFLQLDCVVAGPNGDVYAIQNRWGEYWKSEVNKISGGMVTVVAESTGSSTFVSSAIGGMSFDASGDLYVTDMAANAIWKVGEDHTFKTFAGKGSSVKQRVDGKGDAARFFNATGHARDAAGNIFVIEFYKIRKIAPDATVTTIGPDPSFHNGNSIAMHPSGNLWVSSSAGVGVYSSVDASVIVPPAGERLYFLVSDQQGNLFGWRDDGLYRIPPGGTMADLQKVFHNSGGYADGPFDQPPGFNLVQNMAVDADGNLLVADLGNGRIRKIVFER